MCLFHTAMVLPSNLICCQGRQGSREGSQGYKQSNSSTESFPGLHQNWWPILRTFQQRCPAWPGFTPTAPCRHSLAPPGNTRSLLPRCRQDAFICPVEPTLTEIPEPCRYTCNKPALFTYKKVKSVWVRSLVQKSLKKYIYRKPKSLKRKNRQSVLAWVQIHLTSLLLIVHEVNRKNIHVYLRMAPLFHKAALFPFLFSVLEKFPNINWTFTAGRFSPHCSRIRCEWERQEASYSLDI